MSQIFVAGNSTSLSAFGHLSLWFYRDQTMTLVEVNPSQLFGGSYVLNIQTYVTGSIEEMRLQLEGAGFTLSALNVGGRDPSDVWDIIIQHAYEIDREHITYNLASQNSNSFVASLLSVVDCKLPSLSTPAAGYPGTSNRLNFDYILEGTSSNDRIRGFKGNDDLRGRGGNDEIWGGDGNDSIFGGAGNYILIGGNGDDLLEAGDSNEELRGGNGYDTYLVDGICKVIDSDLRGVLRVGALDGAQLLGGRQDSIGSSLYIDRNGAEYTRVAGGGLSIKLAGGGTITVNGWSKNGDLGIYLTPYQPAKNDEPPHDQNDPLVLDLDGNGLTLTSPRGSTAFFDFNGDGFATRTGWVSATDGLLAVDTNGNGRIDDITELFGTATQNGFQVLSALDSNHDGKIDAADTAWSTLRLWVDANSNGQTEAGELHLLSDTNIASLSLTTTPTPDVTINGNSVVATSTFTRLDGSTGGVGAVFFETIPAETRWVRPDGFVASTLAAERQAPSVLC
jgi:RTX calcium-binding nonapeptide repeat (4 copies)